MPGADATNVPPSTPAELAAADDFMSALGDALVAEYGLAASGRWLEGGVNAFDLSRAMTSRLHSEFEHGYEDPVAKSGDGAQPPVDVELTADMLPLHAPHEVRSSRQSCCCWCAGYIF